MGLWTVDGADHTGDWWRGPTVAVVDPAPSVHHAVHLRLYLTRQVAFSPVVQTLHAPASFFVAAPQRVKGSWTEAAPFQLQPETSFKGGMTSALWREELLVLQLLQT